MGRRTEVGQFLWNAGDRPLKIGGRNILGNSLEGFARRNSKSVVHEMDLVVLCTEVVTDECLIRQSESSGLLSSDQKALRGILRPFIDEELIRIGKGLQGGAVVSYGNKVIDLHTVEIYRLGFSIEVFFNTGQTIPRNADPIVSIKDTLADSSLIETFASLIPNQC
jgi:hypothetical protein